MEWISVNDRLPKDDSEQLFLHVWAGGEWLINVDFSDGEFLEPIEDYQGDYSHSSVIDNATHWLTPEPPKE